MVTKQEAREKYGDIVVNTDGNEVWRPDRNKVRGMIQSFVRAREQIEGATPEPHSSEYIDELWQWLREKMGEGFEAVFQGDEMSPSGKFDRMSKKKLADVAQSFYESNPEFQNEFYQKWVQIKLEDETVTGLEEMTHKMAAEEFRIVEEDEYDMIPNPAEDIDTEAYKKWMKEYALSVESIDKRGSPNAEDFVDSWLSYLEGSVFNTLQVVCREDGGKYNDMFVVPDYSEVVGFARWLWSEDSEFREAVKEKWGRDDSGSGSLGNKISRPDVSGRKEEEQVRLGDFDND